MRDSNGYVPSILPTKAGRCYICNRCTDTARHEVFYGTANRQNSKACGTWVDVCPMCHNELHASPNTGIDLHLKRNAQWCYERTHTRAEFVRVFGRTWL